MYNNRHSPGISASCQDGFTLIELSIVLVIIGLIIGSILVGQDMIKAAAIRAQISQIDKYNAAVNAFRSKYGGLPGDILPATAASFGFVTRAGTVGEGDNNGLLTAGTSTSAQGAGEIVVFWNDLSTANLVDGSFVGVDCAYGGSSCTAASGGGGGTIPLSQIVPPAKLGGNNVVSIYSTAGSNYFQIIGLVSVNNGGGFLAPGGTAAGTLQMTPQQAYAIDSKLDDGYPGTGTVTSTYFNVDPPGPGQSGGAGAGNCAHNDVAPTIYNLGLPYANTLTCSISIRVNF